MNRGDWQRLLHIQTYCRDIARFIDRFGDSYETFTQDRAYFSAVSMCILQIGELANGLSDEFRDQTKTEVPWGPIRGMRNWLAHAYAEMDESVIWETATNDIPKLAAFCQEHIEQDRKTAQEKPSVLAQLKDVQAKQPPQKQSCPKKQNRER